MVLCARSCFRFSLQWYPALALISVFGPLTAPLASIIGINACCSDPDPIVWCFALSGSVKLSLSSSSFPLSCIWCAVSIVRAALS